MFATFLALVMLVLLCGVWVLWRQLYPTPPSRQEPQITLLEQALPDASWRTLSYENSTALQVQTRADGSTAMDFRLASMPVTESEPVDLSYFDSAVFLGDSLTQGLQIYDTACPTPITAPTAGWAQRGGQWDHLHPHRRRTGSAAGGSGLLCAQVGVHPAGHQRPDPGHRLHQLFELLQPDAGQHPGAAARRGYLRPVHHAGAARGQRRRRPQRMYGARFIRVNNDLAALAVEKGCYFLDLWEVLADANGDLKAEYAQPDGYHLLPEGYAAWVNYLRTHVAHTEIVTPRGPHRPDGGQCRSRFGCPSGRLNRTRQRPRPSAGKSRGAAFLQMVQRLAMHSISSRAPLGMAATCTQLRAG